MIAKNEKLLDAMSKFTFLLFLTFYGCGLSNSNTIKDSTTDKVVTKTSIDDSVSVTSEKTIDDTTRYSHFNFLKGCNEFERAIGSIQGATESDSIGPYPIADCFIAKETYELLFVPKEEFSIRKKMSFEDLKKRYFADTSYATFDCYAFVVPMLDPEKQKDMHKDYTQYPSDVKVYKRVRLDSWKLLTKRRINSLSEYARLELDCIFNINIKSY